MNKSYNEIFPKTYEALDTWSKTEELSAQNWQEIETDEDLEACERFDEERAKPVRQALFEETKSINHWSTIQNLSVKTIVSLTKYHSKPQKFEIDLSNLAKGK